ncbi:MAG TPA: hypothetical protein VFB07_07355 [Vicinamibacterales bacterium]|nr:hypothetical protein [Vicinamibacterales bacterium]
MDRAELEAVLSAVQQRGGAPPPAPRRSAARVVTRIILHAASLLLGVAAFVAHEHFAVEGDSTSSLVCLVAAAIFVLLPLRAALGALFGLEGRVLHALHGVGSLALVGLTLTGAVSGAPLLPHAALAPFAIMGAAQAVMHQGQPRNAEQAAAMRRFAASLPEVEQIAGGGNLASPASARRAAAVLGDLIAKAQDLGQTELRSDPGFQSALQAATGRVGLSLGLDAIDRALDTLAGQPAAAAAVPELRRKLAAARKTIQR